MPNHVQNKLEIHCQDKEAMDKIKKMIFDEDSKMNVVFTMKKMLPKPKAFSEDKEFDGLGYNWCLSVWGTKWDVYNVEIEENSEKKVLISYYTAWSPNFSYLEILYAFIESSIRVKDASERPRVTTNHRFSSMEGDFGGSFEWQPGKEGVFMEYSYEDYCRIYEPNTFIFREEV